MKKKDIILIAVILLTAGIIFAVLHFMPAKSAYVKVEADKEVVAVLPLDEDTEYDIKTQYGVNTLVIKDGAANVLKADCPDKTCVRHNEISKNGESIICLPHKVVITVIDENEKNEIDAEV